MLRGLAGLTLALFLGACGTASKTRQARITLEHDSGTTWRATYVLPAPARELRFERETSPFRGRVFEVATPGYSFVRDGQAEILRTDGQPSDTITLRFPEYTEELEKEYDFFQKFSDGSVAIYTGHLLAAADGRAVRTIRFAPRSGQSVVVAGTRSPSPLDWTDETGEGTYAYFGSIPPIETADAISIIDPGLPGWLQARTRRMLPELFELFTRELGVRLPARPVVLFNYARGNDSGYTSGGGTLPNVIQLRVEGRAWEQESEEGLLHLFHFLAHEAAHLWNGQIANYPGTEHSWMHEGGADAMAERALLDLGQIDQKRYLEYQTAALNACRSASDTGSLREAGTRGSFDLYYSCGNAIALFTDAAIDTGLFGFWKSLVARTLAKAEPKYGVDDYFAVWRELGADDGDVSMLRSIVEEPSGTAKIAEALRLNGVGIEETDDVPQSYGQSLSRRALMHLLKQHCRGRYGFRSTPAGFELDAPLDCGQLPPGGLVKLIGGEDVIRAGHRAWDVLHSRCCAEGAITVHAGGRDVNVPCSVPAPARPAYLRVTSVP